MNDKLSELRSYYFESILAAETEEELYSILPSVTFSNFTDIMRGIIPLLEKELQENLSIFSSEKDLEIKELFREEIRKIQEKLNICKNVLAQQFVIKNASEEKIDESQKNNIIFGVNPAGNVAFFNDLRKNVDEHYYLSILGLLTSLIDGSAFENSEVVRRFSGANNKLQGIYEAKDYQIRIIFRLLGSNMIYIDMVRVKKDDRSTRDFNEPIKRCSLLNSDFENVKRKLKNNDNIEELIIRNEEILQEIIEFIDSKTKKEGKINNG